MKIGSSHDLSAVDGTQRGSRAAGTGAATRTSAVATDQVALSAAGSALVKGDADFDQAKVDAIRTAIQEGRFTVNAGAIADQLIADASALLQPRQA
ncbi:flagellar biosynthesis anti-sigma factor FlgM [Ramlibacter sp. MMS24-I3-19]|uniref:flagellar biosynthesis anti-sigma factor FlgM n=1 Tax=Ramlibacter sp. MMS24-I3-19 TaxID=3416606 RepID=UPI003D03E301